MSRAASVLLLALAVGGCSNGANPPGPPSGVQAASIAASARPAAGALQIEPDQIVFSNERSGSQPVRVWQHGYRGRFRVRNGCVGVNVRLQHYTRGNAALWKVRPTIAGPQSCDVVFSGTGGPRGTRRLKIRLLTQ